MKEVDEVSVEIVIHLKRHDLRIAEQYASATAEYIHKSTVFHWENGV